MKRVISFLSAVLLFVLAGCAPAPIEQAQSEEAGGASSSVKFSVYDDALSSDSKYDVLRQLFEDTDFLKSIRGTDKYGNPATYITLCKSGEHYFITIDYHGKLGDTCAVYCMDYTYFFAEYEGRAFTAYDILEGTRYISKSDVCLGDAYYTSYNELLFSAYDDDLKEKPLFGEKHKSADSDGVLNTYWIAREENLVSKDSYYAARSALFDSLPFEIKTPYSNILDIRHKSANLIADRILELYAECNSADTQEYLYQPPDIVSFGNYQSDRIVHELRYGYRPNDDEIYSFLPHSIVSDMEACIAKTKLPDGKFSWFGIDRFDLDGDGTEDYIVLGELIKPDRTSKHPSDTPYVPVSRIYLCKGGGEFKAIDFSASSPLDNSRDKYFVSNKTNGVFNFLVPYVTRHYDLIAYDGENAYISKGRITTDYEWEYAGNDRIKITVECSHNGYAGLKVLTADSFLNENYLYSSAPDGTPVKVSGGKAEFYATINLPDSFIGACELYLAPENSVIDTSYRYAPPSEVLNTRFYSKDIITQLEFETHTVDYNWEKVEDEAYRDECVKQYYSYYPKEIVNDIYTRGNGSLFDCTIKEDGAYIVSMGDMRYDLNGDGVLDYIIEAVATTCGPSGEWDVYRAYITQKDGSFKAVHIPTYLRNHPAYYLLSSKTNGLNDLLITRNGNEPAAFFNGKNEYAGSDYLDDWYTSGITIEPYSENIAVCRMKMGHKLSGSYYVALNLYDNPYLKESLLYSCTPTGLPYILGDDEWDATFYAEIKDGVTLPDDAYVIPTEIRYIPPQ